MNTFEISPFRLEGDVWLILDQTRLPGTEVYLRPETKEDIWHAINTLQVRGAPAIGIAAAYGLWLSVKDFTGNTEEFAKTLQAAKDYLVTARPTAVNLAWALERMWNTWRKSQPCDIITSKDLLFAEAKKIYEEDVAACKAMGEYGLTLLKPGMGILTHCNAEHWRHLNTEPAWHPSTWDRNEAITSMYSPTRHARSCREHDSPAGNCKSPA